MQAVHSLESLKTSHPNLLRHVPEHSNFYDFFMVVWKNSAFFFFRVDGDESSTSFWNVHTSYRTAWRHIPEDPSLKLYNSVTYRRAGKGRRKL